MHMGWGTFLARRCIRPWAPQVPVLRVLLARDSRYTHLYIQCCLRRLISYSGGFGLGALNDADEDDLDVYDNAQRPSSSRRRVAYDHIEGVDDDDMVHIGTSTGEVKKMQEMGKGSSLHVRGMTLTLVVLTHLIYWEGDCT
jgi:hypothetical protein